MPINTGSDSRFVALCRCGQRIRSRELVTPYAIPRGNWGFHGAYAMKTPSTMCDTLAVTTAVGCPNACKVCPQELFVGRYRQTKGIKYLRFDCFKRCLDGMPRHVRIDFGGMGEPWSNPECTEMILYAHEIGFKLTVFTTCVGMTISDLQQIRHIPFVTFVVHLPDDGLNMPFPKMHGYMAVLKELCLTHIAHVSFMAMGSIHPDLQALFCDNVSGYIFTDRAGNLAGSHPIRKTGIIRCIVSQEMRRNVLLPNGDVVLCCQDWGMQNVLGNLNAGKYEDLFTSQQYRNVLARQNSESEGDILCRYCEWSGSRLRAKSIWVREVVKETIQPIRKRAVHVKNLFFTIRP